MNRLPSLRWPTSPRVLALLAALSASPALAQFRIEFQAPRRPAQVAPRVQAYVFGARNHADDLAAQLMRQANAICVEMHRNYGHNPGFRETYREMYQVLQDAKHIHELVHNRYHQSRRQGDDHIARDLHSMDDLLHHVEEDIASWTPGHAHAQHDLFYRGGQGQSQTLHRLVHGFSDTLHHMMTDYGVRSRLGQTEEAPSPDGLTAPPPDRSFPTRPRRP